MRSHFIALPILALVACSAASDGTDEDESREVWDSANNPAYVDGTFVLDVAGLPVLGTTAQALIPGDYWATAKDSVNVRWDGDNPSAAEKLEQALAKPGLALQISQAFGIRAQMQRKECTVEADCSDQKDGSGCSIARGETKGRCVPGWWGICHGWSPYALSEPAPVKEVKVGNVTFYPGDLEGLMSLAYSKNLPTRFVGKRCNKDITDGEGRLVETECRDINPGALFVIASNMLGLRKQGFVEDRTFDDQVWNQPVHSFKVTNAEAGKLKEVTKAEAVRMLGAGFTYKQLLPKTTLKKGDRKIGTFTATKAGEHVLQTNGNGDVDLYVKIGGAATEQASDCRSSGGGSSEKCTITAKAGDVINYLLLGYADTSEAELSVGEPDATTTYSFNPDADKLFYVEMDLDYVTEARPERVTHSTPEQLQAHLRTDHYQFILETKGGKVTGGEYVGDSMRNHPDFFWWPAGKPSGTLVGTISYEDIRKIHDQAKASAPAAEDTVLLDNVLVSGVSKYVAVGLKGGQKMVVMMTGTGEADLYVGLGSKPTIYRSAAKSTNPGASETAEVTAPAAGGTYWVRVRPVSGTSTVTVKAKISG